MPEEGGLRGDHGGQDLPVPLLGWAVCFLTDFGSVGQADARVAQTHARWLRQKGGHHRLTARGDQEGVPLEGLQDGPIPPTNVYFVCSTAHLDDKCPLEQVMTC